MSFCGVSHITIGDIQAVLTLTISIITLLGLLAGTGFAIWQYKLYKKLMASEQAIRDKQNEIDAVEPDINRRTNGFNVTEKQRVAQVNVALKPLLRDLERLKEERDFIKDKLLFAKK
jgi:hypothetical protein